MLSNFVDKPNNVTAKLNCRHPEGLGLELGLGGEVYPERNGKLGVNRECITA